jgi:diketogulonate reductase-like aldo/keto reductase
MLALSHLCLAAVPTIPIAPDVHMPLVGIGTWLYNSTVAQGAVSTALSLGYRHIDTALGYDNQVGVGKAIAAGISGLGIQRSDLFVVSKIPGGLSSADTASNLSLALEQLFPKDPSAYVDLMLVHFPATWSGVGGKALRQAEWVGLEAFAKAGKAKAIGISHYCKKHLDDVMEVATIKPAVNQVQYHVGMGTAGGNATDDLEYMRAKGVTFESFSPLCGPCDPPDNHELLNGSLVTSIGAKHNKSGAQVSLKWQVQQGIPVIPKSSNPMHIAENLDLFSWTLSDEEMKALTAATKPPVAGEPGPAGAPVSGDCDVE